MFSISLLDKKPVNLSGIIPRCSSNPFMEQPKEEPKPIPKPIPKEEPKPIPEPIPKEEPVDFSTIKSENDIITLLYKSLQELTIRVQQNKICKKVPIHSDSKVNQILEYGKAQYPKSNILEHYKGVYYSTVRREDESEEAYRESMSLNPSFVASPMNLAKHYFQNNNIEGAVKLLVPYFGKSKKSITNEQMIEIGAILSMAYNKLQKRKEEKQVYDVLYTILTGIPKWTGYHLMSWKNLHQCLGAYYGNIDDEVACEYFSKGLDPPASHIRSDLSLLENEQTGISQLDKTLYQSKLVSLDYVYNLPKNIDSVYKQCDTVYHFEPNVYEPNVYSPHSKIRVGYFTADLNKNAVGLFCGPLLKHFDKDKFEVYVFYNNKSKDEFTEIFRSWVPQHQWFDVHYMGDSDTASLIIKQEIDILIDLEGHAHGGRMSLFSYLPSNIITLTYLGYPNTTGSSFLKYRLTDKICDPEDTKQYYSETLIRLPRAFICYKLFENVPLPSASYNNDTSEVHIGVFNKMVKQNPTMRTIWKRILKNNPKAVLYVKLDNDYQRKVYEDFPKNQLRFLPFQVTLDGYLKQFQDMDFCIDTFPYSGTTTTCSNLLMGLPTFTIYNPKKHRHVSNVSSSLMLHVLQEDGKKYVCKSEEDYEKKISNEIRKIQKEKTTEEYNEKEEKNRDIIRGKFLTYMNPKEFMRDYEQILSGLYHDKS
jgi:Predicted O-linked N-acetylglucosamine transferase, SPINDLY family